MEMYFGCAEINNDAVIYSKNNSKIKFIFYIFSFSSLFMSLYKALIIFFLV